ncbi:hypothetical protein CVS40_11175 [Lucilia cuprina]|nr:hypothetical protein CVS40_11175 [Lucilia cuprina]
MGNHGLAGNRNDNDERIKDLCAQHQLFIGGTKFPHRNIHKYTWESPDGISRNQIDHFLISRKFFDDHQPLVDIVKLRPRANYHQGKPTGKLNLNRLRNPEIAANLFNLTCSRMEGQPQSWANFLHECHESARIVLAEKKCDEYKEAVKRVKRSVRNDKRQYMNQIAQQAEFAFFSRNKHDVYVRKLSDMYLDTQPHGSQEHHIPTTAPTLDELLKYAPDLTTYILLIIQEYWHSADFPGEWNEGILVTIPKKGNLKPLSKLE